MWPDSQFAVPVGSFSSPVPVVQNDPTQGPFFYVAVNQAWMPYIQGALLQLTLQTTWDTNDPAILNLVQQQAMALMNQFTIATDQCPAGSQPTLIKESEYEMSVCEQLRFQNGKLQGLCCGVWTDIQGQTSGQLVGGAGQAGPGLGTPAPGGNCQTYHAVMQGNSLWNAPFGVNAGDIITVSNGQGAASDGTLGPWLCWNGDTYFLGIDIPGTGGPVGTDPLPTAKHMSLICKINGVYYSCLSPITVPAGVVNAPVVFQVNDSTVSDNGGSLAYDVQYCNNAAASWCYKLDMALSTQGFVNTPIVSTPTTSGQWTSGSGWGITLDGPDGSNDYWRRLLIQRTGLAPFQITRVDATFNLTQGGSDSPAITGLQVAAGVSGVKTNIINLAYNALVNGNGQTKSGSVTVDNVDSLYVQLQAAEHGGGAPGAATGLITALTVYGTGTCPFGTPNC